MLFTASWPGGPFSLPPSLIGNPPKLGRILGASDLRFVCQAKFWLTWIMDHGVLHAPFHLPPRMKDTVMDIILGHGDGYHPCTWIMDHRVLHAPFHLPPRMKDTVMDIILGVFLTLAIIRLATHCSAFNPGQNAPSNVLA
ncbi:uncharacterized protein F5147DRAFT_650236 [Suillus discolor]|uniref:Uncharacterized protein n=1 Tax=Suillus discolor TaxID=1912936 RepID=A0A9P7FEE2_9AGAM|nr:uncharacterized protein F5147DRAFT_650236 [Suillus discolor]KAG2113828.1 hypothetical protein F5147DRAFT_650236 [Suillus discolor]